MFQYQSLFRRNAGGEAGKIIGLTVLAGILMTVSFFIVFLIAMSPLLAIGESAWAIFYAIIIFFLLLLFSVFVIYPLSIGILKFFTSAYQGERYGFSDLFFVFKEGRYGKAIKLTLLVLIAYMIINFGISMLMQLVLTLVNLPFSAALGGMSYEGIEPSAALITGQIGLFILMVTINLLVVFAMYIPFILLMIYMLLLYLVYVDQPRIPTFDKFTIAFKVMFQTGQSIVKLFFSNVFLLIGVTVLYIITIIAAVLIGGVVLGATDSGVLFALMMIIVGTALLAVYIYVMYIMLGSVVAFYFEGRHELDLRAAEAVSYGREAPGRYENPRDDGLEPLDGRNY